MGFSGVVSQLIMFIAVLFVATGLVIVFKGFMDSTTSSIVIQQNRVSDQLETDITIEVIDYDNTTATTTVYAKNTGKTKLKIDLVDIYIDEERFPRNDSNRTITVLSDTEIINLGIWDPKEVIKIQAFRNLTTDKSYDVTILTQNGIKDSDEFSI